MDRLAMLRQMATAKPDDAFVKYGLAMELHKQELRDEARATFEKLVQDHPDYVATYLMFGGLLVEMGDKARAREVFDLGIGVATKAGDTRAVDELGAARSEL